MEVCREEHRIEIMFIFPLLVDLQNRESMEESAQVVEADCENSKPIGYRDLEELDQ